MVRVWVGLRARVRAGLRARVRAKVRVRLSAHFCSKRSPMNSAITCGSG
jgi:hypothetical protein